MTATMIELDDGAQLRTWTAGSVIPQRFPVVMVYGGPGVPDHLAPVAGIIDDLCQVHRYDQRDTGGSSWEGEHTIVRRRARYREPNDNLAARFRSSVNQEALYGKNRLRRPDRGSVQGGP